MSAQYKRESANAAWTLVGQFFKDLVAACNGTLNREDRLVGTVDYPQDIY